MFLRKHYFKYATSLTSTDIMKTEKDMGLSGTIFLRGNDLAVFGRPIVYGMQL